MNSKPLLDALNLEVRYGGIAAVKGVSFSVMEGEMVCLLGANGAGKTSTLKALARMIPSAGEIHYAGDKINQLESHLLIRKGLALVPRGTRNLCAADDRRKPCDGRLPPQRHGRDFRRYRAYFRNAAAS